MVRKGQTTTHIKPLPEDRVNDSERFTFLNNKGGVGKTTLAIALSLYAARTGKNVLLFDFDSQCNLSQRMGLSDSMFLNRRLNEFFRHLDADNSDAENMNFPISIHFPWFYRVPGTESKAGNISIIAGSHDAIYAAEYSNKTLSNARLNREDPRTLLERFESALNEFRKYYDVIVIDTAPALEGSVLGELAARTADEIICPVDGLEAALGLSHLIFWLDTANPRYTGAKRPNMIFCMNKYQVDTGDVRDVIDEFSDAEIKNVVYRALKVNLDGYMCDNGIKEIPSLKNTVYAGFGKKNKYDALCEEIFEKAGQTRPNIFDYYETHLRGLETDLKEVSQKVLSREPIFLIPRYLSANQEGNDDVETDE